MIGRPAAKPKPEKTPRAKRERPPKAERTRKPSLLSRLRRPRQRRSLSDYSDRALLAQYRRSAGSKGWRLGLLTLLGVLAIAWGLTFGLTAPFQVMPMIAPLVGVAFLIIWVLPRGRYAPTGAMEPLLLAFLAALVLWPNYIALALPHMPWLTLLRIIVTPLILILLISLSVSPKFRRDLGSVINSDPVLWRMLLGFVVLQTISLALTKNLGISLNRYIVAQMNQSAIFIVSCFVFLTPGFTERWARALIVLAYVVCFFGIWENDISALPWAGHIPALLKIDGDLIENMLAGAARSAIGIHRVQSVATTPLGLAELLGLTAPFAVHMAIEKRPWWVKILAIAYLPLALYLILLADSRLGIVAMIGAALFYVLVWGALQWSTKKDSLLAPALVMAYPALFTGVILASFFVGKLRAKVWGSGGQQASSDARATQWKLATPKILTHPLGHGIGQSAGEVGFHSPNGMGTLDSYYITVLMDYGVLGFILYFGMFIRASWQGGKMVVTHRPVGELTMLLPLVVALMNFVVIKSVFSQQANHPLVFMMLGAVVALTYRAQQEAQKLYVPKTPSITPR